MNDDIDGIYIYDEDAAESVFEGDLEQLTDWIKEQNFDAVIKCTYDDGYIEITCEDDNEYYIDDISEIKDFLNEYGSGSYSIYYYRDREEIVQDTMFLTLRECKEHIEANNYHYHNPHPYAMTAWRSPQVERLYKILQETDWDKIKIE